jgi:8-oxo-dGTP diphosphatase
MPDLPRLDPPQPILAASVAVIRYGRVLLAARGREPMRGVYSLPGGAVEVGETLAEAARREVVEETGVEIAEPVFLGHREIIERTADGRVERHYVICVFAADWVAGEPAPTSEATDFRWVAPQERPDLEVSPGLWEILARLGDLRGRDVPGAGGLG